MNMMSTICNDCGEYANIKLNDGGHSCDKHYFTCDRCHEKYMTVNENTEGCGFCFGCSQKELEDKEEELEETYKVNEQLYDSRRDAFETELKTLNATPFFKAVVKNFLSFIDETMFEDHNIYDLFDEKRKGNYMTNDQIIDQQNAFLTRLLANTGITADPVFQNLTGDTD